MPKGTRNQSKNMKAQHTQGPWEMSGPTLKGDGYNIGSVNSHRTSEGEANARLISAAPDLLVALEAMVEASIEMQGTTRKAAEHNARLESARAAIAKAKGTL